jgi:uncharacterized protein YjaZ
MKFHNLDAEAIYRRLLDTSDADTRTAIFRQELVEPFAGLVQVFGGGDPLQSFAMWGMSPAQFNPENAATTRQMIDALAAHHAWERAAQALETGRDAFAQYADRIPTQDVTFALLLSDMSKAPISYGYSGFGAIPGWIMTVYDKPNAFNLERVEAATVHELHHNILAAVLANEGGLISNLATYLISEGLAESFAAELYSAEMVGPWVSAFDETRLDEAKRLIHAALDETNFHKMRLYIFGDTMSGQALGVPDFAGYALGFRIVQAYLRRTGKSVVEATFVPAREIIAVSEFFN